MHCMKRAAVHSKTSAEPLPLRCTRYIQHVLSCVWPHQVALSTSHWFSPTLAQLKQRSPALTRYGCAATWPGTRLQRRCSALHASLPPRSRPQLRGRPALPLGACCVGWTPWCSRMQRGSHDPTAGAIVHASSASDSQQRNRVNTQGVPSNSAAQLHACRVYATVCAYTWRWCARSCSWSRLGGRHM